MKSKLSLFSLVLMLGVFPLTRAQAWEKYEDACRDDSYSGQSPPVEEPVRVAGFKLTVDTTELGYSVYQPPKDGVLARLHGNDVDVVVTRVAAASKKSIDETVAKAANGNGDVVKVMPLKNRFGLKGYRVTYGGKANWFSNHITEIQYYLINAAGETICFSAHANKKYPDWDYFKYLMTEMTEPIRA